MVHSVENMLDPTWPEVSLLLILTGVSVYLFVRRLAPVLRIIQQSKRDPGVEPNAISHRIRLFVWEVLLQAKVIRERPLPGIAHALVFWGFLAFAIVTVDHLSRGFGRQVLDRVDAIGLTYFGVAAFFALLVIAGMTFLAIRRFVFHPIWLGPLSKESAVIAVLILVLMVTYLFDYGWAVEGTTSARVNWWMHTLTLLIFLPLIPHTKHLHLLLSPVTIFLTRGSFSRIPPLVGDDDFGLDTGKDITGIVALQAFSCVECGRCTEHCPANRTGKLLDPKKVILGVRQYLRDHGPAGTESIVSKYVPDEMLWQCTSCGACEYQCPVGIEHVPIIIGLRRAQVNTGRWEDEHGGKLFLNLERNGNALGIAASERDKFLRKAELPAYDGTQEYCLWLGCMGSLDPNGREIILSLVEIFEYMGVSFGVLKKERCTGDPVRRLGNDYLFTELAEKNIEQIRASGVTKMISICPHCVRTIGDDWNEVGANVQIEHHSEFLARNVHRLPQGTVDRTKVVFHDPCYLGRYRNIYDEPRDVIDRAASVTEPERTKERSFCCGAGGGRAFLGEEAGKRVSVERAEELVAAGTQVIGAACPFCSTMFRDALAQIAPAGPKLLDIAQIAAASLPKTTPKS
jgi:Fe-S oxidoreductase